MPSRRDWSTRKSSSSCGGAPITPRGKSDAQQKNGMSVVLYTFNMPFACQKNHNEWRTQDTLVCIQWSRFRYIIYIYTIAICKHIVCTVRDIIISCTASQVSPLSRNCWSLRCDPLRVSTWQFLQVSTESNYFTWTGIDSWPSWPQKKMNSEFLLFLAGIHEDTYEVGAKWILDLVFFDIRKVHIKTRLRCVGF